MRQYARRVAIGLVKSCGVRKMDVVSAQLPAWWQMQAVTFGAMSCGAIVNPLLPTFREKELTYMLNFDEAKVIVVPKSFKGFDYPALLESIRKDIPTLKHVLAVGTPSFDERILGFRWE